MSGDDQNPTGIELAFVPADERFLDWTIAGTVEYDGKRIIVAAASKDMGTIKTMRTVLERCAVWSVDHTDRIFDFLNRSLNEDQGIGIELGALILSKVVFHESLDHGEYFSIWCDCAGGDVIAFVSLDDYSFIGPAEVYW